ncbi:MAG: response regulator [Gammaproteobacteria bacterium]|nr:response regulator [Gammaproteobacteria bacterium]
MDNTINVILLTDSSTIDGLITSLLDSERFTIKAVHSSDPNYFQLILDSKPELIFIRAMLSHVDGLSLCDRIRSHPALNKARLVFMSSDTQNREFAIDHRANKFLKLPFSRQDLSQAVNPLFEEKAKLLLVDDSKTCRKLIKPSLEQEGFEVIEAENGEQALKIIRNSKIDIIISDVDMPILDGITLCRIIRQQEKLDTPVLLLSSQQTDKAIISGFNAGADDYIIKSDRSATRKVVVPELLSRIQRLMNSSHSQGRPERILVVEDSATILHQIKKSLLIQGFLVDVATDGLSAWEKLNSNLYDLVITDYDMPYVDGLELCTRIRQSNQFENLPIIIETGKDSRADQVKIRSIGIQAFITKPFSPDRMVAEVERVLAESRLKRHQSLMSHYLSDSTVTHISMARKNTDEPIAEDKFRTLLFSDIVQFAHISEQLSSRKVVDFLNLYFDRMVEKLMFFDATIDKFIGDGIFASFGLQEEGAFRAVCAAAAMLKALPDLRKTTGLDVHMRIGIHSGHVILGDIGSRHSRRDFTLIGDNVNIANRLEHLSKHDGVLISHATYKMIQDRITVVATPPLKLKGIKEPVQAYLVKSIKSYHSFVKTIEETSCSGKYYKNSIEAFFSYDT